MRLNEYCGKLSSVPMWLRRHRDDMDDMLMGRWWRSCDGVMSPVVATAAVAIADIATAGVMYHCTSIYTATATAVIVITTATVNITGAIVYTTIILISLLYIYIYIYHCGHLHYYHKC